MQLLMAGLAALPLEARRMLPESILALLQYRRRENEHLSPTFDDSSLPGEDALLAWRSGHRLACWQQHECGTDDSGLLKEVWRCCEFAK